MSAALIASDWGTTNRRVYRLNGDGSVAHTERERRQEEPDRHLNRVLKLAVGGHHRPAKSPRNYRAALPISLARLNTMLSVSVMATMTTPAAAVSSV